MTLPTPSGPEQYTRTVVICGSLSDPQRITAAVTVEQAAGREVIAAPLGQRMGDDLAAHLWRGYIADADEVVVVPKADGRLGEATVGEIVMAAVLRKPVRVHLDVLSQTAAPTRAEVRVSDEEAQRSADQVNADAKRLDEEIGAHPRGHVIEALAEALQEVDDDAGNGSPTNYYRSLAYAAVEYLPELRYERAPLPTRAEALLIARAAVGGPDLTQAERVAEDILTALRAAGILTWRAEP